MTRPADILQKLQSELAEATWELLGPHLTRGGLIEVRGIELIAAAMAIALDRKDDVQGWLESGRLLPSERLSADRYPLDTKVELIIVQPYVVFRVCTTPETPSKTEVN
jgi:hypothetical protein